MPYLGGASSGTQVAESSGNGGGRAPGLATPEPASQVAPASEDAMS